MNKADQDIDAREGLALVRRAVAGEREARHQVSAIAHPLIHFQCERLCKRFCHGNCKRYVCSLLRPWGAPPSGAALCEWGNASYAWMLEDLTGETRLQQYQGRQGASLGRYFYVIANSLPFYERWKDWRFDDNVHVPTYIKSMAALASKVFLALRKAEALPNIAQKLAVEEQLIEDLAQRIVVELTRRNRLYLLDAPKTQSLSVWDANAQDLVQADIPCEDLSWDDIEQHTQLHQAWQKLDPVEQFVLEASVIEQQDAAIILAALKKLKFSIAKGVAPEDTDRQQLYYFRRKALGKLAQWLEMSA